MKKYIGFKKPVREKKTSFPQTVAGFGILLKGNSILVIQDNPLKKKRCRWKDHESFFKLPGGVFPSKKEGVKLLSRKIREETGVSSIHISIKRDPFFIKEKRSHTVYFYLMKYIGGDPISGKKVQFANFLSLSEIQQKIKYNEFLEVHQLALKTYLKTLACS